MHAVPVDRPCGLVVLGYPSKRNGTARRIQRRRVIAAVHTGAEYDADLIVMSGGAVRNSVVEAETMVAEARELGVGAERLVAEGRSRTTWENVSFSAPLVRHCATVLIVSEPLHAARALGYWHQQFPDDTGRVFVAPHHRAPGDWWLLPPLLVYERLMRARDRLQFGT